MKKNILIVCLILTSVVSTGFLLPNNASRFVARLGTDLGLVETKPKHKMAIPEKSFLANPLSTFIPSIATRFYSVPDFTTLPAVDIEAF